MTIPGLPASRVSSRGLAVAPPPLEGVLHGALDHLSQRVVVGLVRGSGRRVGRCRSDRRSVIVGGIGQVPVDVGFVGAGGGTGVVGGPSPGVGHGSGPPTSASSRAVASASASVRSISAKRSWSSSTRRLRAWCDVVGTSSQAAADVALDGHGAAGLVAAGVDDLTGPLVGQRGRRVGGRVGWRATSARTWAASPGPPRSSRRRPADRRPPSAARRPPPPRRPGGRGRHRPRLGAAARPPSRGLGAGWSPPPRRGRPKSSSPPTLIAACGGVGRLVRRRQRLGQRGGHLSEEGVHLVGVEAPPHQAEHVVLDLVRSHRCRRVPSPPRPADPRSLDHRE